MPRNRLILATLAFVLVAAACGGGDDSTSSSSGDDNLPETFTTSDSGPEGSPEVSSGADTTTDGEQMDSTAPDPTSETAPLDSPSGTEPQDSIQPEASSQPVVRLGSRFGWCADVQAIWDAHDEALAVVRVLEDALQEAQAAFDAATDDLDRAEIRGVLDNAAASHTNAQDAFDAARGRATRYLAEARKISNRERMPEAQANAVRGDETLQIAVDRAWAALLDADSQLAALSAAVPVGTSGDVPAPPRRFTPTEILAELRDGSPRLINGAAQEAAREVYSQADRTLIAEALLATALEIAGGLGLTWNTNPILHLTGGSVLAAFDAPAYEAARSADPTAPPMLIDSAEIYVRSISNTLVFFENFGGVSIETAIEFVMGENGQEIEVPTYYQYLIGEWPVDAGEIALSGYNERQRAVYDALPVALELAREATAALQAAEEAERARLKEAEQALQDALEALATGSDAYTTFKRSFEESCQ